MLNRPTFIFADENHQSTFLSNLLSQLAPQFKQAGFQHFYYECSSEFSREQLIQCLKDQIALSEAGKTLLPEIKKEMLDYLPQPVPSRALGLNLDFLNRTDLNYKMLILHFSRIMADKKDTPYEFYLTLVLAILERKANEIGINNMTRSVVEKQLTKIVEEFKLPTETVEANIRMLQMMAENQIEYKGVDDALTSNLISMKTLSQTLDAIQVMKDLPVTLDQRNKTMIRAYLQSRAPVIGFTGMLHVSGMQQLLTTMIPEDIAKANYNFIYVYREPLDTPSPELNKLREDLRTGKLALPLGVILIDGMNKTEEEIAAEVMLRINEKIAAYDALPDHLKLIPDISFTGQVRAQLGSLYGVFSRAKDSVYQTTVETAASVRSAMHL